MRTQDQRESRPTAALWIGGGRGREGGRKGGEEENVILAVYKVRTGDPFMLTPPALLNTPTFLHLNKGKL